MFDGHLYGPNVPNERERGVTALVAQGLKNSEVAEALGTTEHVVRNYLRVIYDMTKSGRFVRRRLSVVKRRKVGSDKG